MKFWLIIGLGCAATLSQAQKALVPLAKNTTSPLPKHFTACARPYSEPVFYPPIPKYGSFKLPPAMPGGLMPITTGLCHLTRFCCKGKSGQDQFTIVLKWSGVQPAFPSPQPIDYKTIIAPILKVISNRKIK